MGTVPGQRQTGFMLAMRAHGKGDAQVGTERRRKGRMQVRREVGKEGGAERRRQGKKKKGGSETGKDGGKQEKRKGRRRETGNNGGRGRTDGDRERGSDGKREVAGKSSLHWFMVFIRVE